MDTLARTRWQGREETMTGHAACSLLRLLALLWFRAAAADDRPELRLAAERENSELRNRVAALEAELKVCRNTCELDMKSPENPVRSTATPDAPHPARSAEGPLTNHEPASIRHKSRLKVAPTGYDAFNDRMHAGTFWAHQALLPCGPHCLPPSVRARTQVCTHL